MKIIPELPQAIDEAVAVLSAGGVVIHATETCYGIACDLTNPKAVERLFQIKNRPQTQPVSALFSDLDAAQEYLDLNPKALEIAQKYLPGPLTIIVPQKFGSQPIFVTAAPLKTQDSRLTTTIGLRISSHSFATSLASAFKKPIATTSANIHGKPEAYSVPDLLAQFDNQQFQPDLIIDGASLPKTAPSTIIQIDGETIKVLRQGGIRIS